MGTPRHRYNQGEPTPATALVMLAAALTSLLVANSGAHAGFHAFWNTTVLASVGGVALDFTVKDLVNKLLMTVFFFLMGLRIRHDFGFGRTGGRKGLALPVAAALGGIIGPVAAYLLVTLAGGYDSSGWGVPAATGLAFAVGVMALLKDRVPTSAKALLNFEALGADIAAVVLIAFVYTRSVDILWLAVSLAIVVALVALRKTPKAAQGWCWLLGALLWAGFLLGGVHPTMAGVILAFCLPGGGGQTSEMLDRIRRVLSPVVFYGIVPLFAFANGDVRIVGSGVQVFAHPVFWGITLGLAIGKPLGTVLFAGVAAKTGHGSLPADCTWLHVTGVGFLCGIGFPMALFVANLAFPDAAMLEAAKAGVLAGSLIAGIVGYALLNVASRTIPDRPER